MAFTEFQDGATSIGSGIGGFLGGMFNPILGTQQTVTESQNTSPNEKSSNMVLIIVVVLVVGIIGYFSLKGNKPTT